MYPLFKWLIFVLSTKNDFRKLTSLMYVAENKCNIAETNFV